MVFVGTVTDDIRLLDVPKLTVAALKFTETARARITKAGGKCMTLDELVMTVPTGTYSLLIFTQSIYLIIYKRVSIFQLNLNLCKTNRFKHSPSES